MKQEEAIEIIKVALAEVEWEYPLNYAAAFDEAIRALEKQIPVKKHRYMGYRCSCEEEVAKNQSYCEYCGQHLADWREE